MARGGSSSSVTVTAGNTLGFDLGQSGDGFSTTAVINVSIERNRGDEKECVLDFVELHIAVDMLPDRASSSQWAATFDNYINQVPQSEPTIPKWHYVRRHYSREGKTGTQKLNCVFYN